MTDLICPRCDGEWWAVWQQYRGSLPSDSGKWALAEHETRKPHLWRSGFPGLHVVAVCNECKLEVGIE